MKREIIINSTLNEVRIAITEDGRLAELFIDMPDNEKYIGNIYMGKVNKVIQGINAAFINIGLDQDAFLHFSDIDESLENLITDEEDEEEERRNKKKSGNKGNQQKSGKPNQNTNKSKSKDQQPRSKNQQNTKSKDKDESTIEVDLKADNKNKVNNIKSNKKTGQKPTRKTKSPQQKDDNDQKNSDQRVRVRPKGSKVRPKSTGKEETENKDNKPSQTIKKKNTPKKKSTAVNTKGNTRRTSNSPGKTTKKTVSKNKENDSEEKGTENNKQSTKRPQKKTSTTTQKKSPSAKSSKKNDTSGAVKPQKTNSSDKDSSATKKTTRRPSKNRKDDEKGTNKNIPATNTSKSSSIALRTEKHQPKADSKLATFHTKKHGQLQINLEAGQEVIVQVAREAYGNKGVKVTTKIGIPGRYVVLLPFDNLIGVSKKIGSYQERRRLRTLAKRALPDEYGLIIRTAAQNKSEEELRRDLRSLVKVWREVEKKVKNSTSPVMLYEDMPVAMSVVRDLFNQEVSKVVIDSKKLYKEITGYLKWASPHLLEKVEQYTGKKPIFEAFGIEKELANTYNRNIYLPSGGSIVIEQTEAMFVVDVNSGRSISDAQQEDNAFNTNIEAAKEIARQVRLRDIAGIILVDFIDMNRHSNRKKLYNEMRKELSRDRAKTVVYPLSQLNLMQITRQRINQNISEKLSEVCPTCSGTGRIISKAVLMNHIERWLKNFRAHSREFRLTLVVHPNLADYLTEGTISKLSRMMIKYFVKIKIQLSNHLRVDEFRFISNRNQADITKDFS